MFRSWDWECARCGTEQWALIDVPHGQPSPTRTTMPCGACSAETMHERLPPLLATYMGERVCNPMVSGGSFDTTGNVQPPPLPDLPGANEHAAKATQTLARAGRGNLAEARRETAQDAPSAADYATLFKSPEYREVKAAREKVKRENVQKKQRLSALRRGEQVNFRRDKCIGDPKMTA